MAQRNSFLPLHKQESLGSPNTHRLSSLASGPWRSLQALWKVSSLFGVGKYSPLQSQSDVSIFLQTELTDARPQLTTPHHNPKDSSQLQSCPAEVPGAPCSSNRPQSVPRYHLVCFCLIGFFFNDKNSSQGFIYFRQANAPLLSHDPSPSLGGF